jgi:hypothetical protein
MQLNKHKETINVEKEVINVEESSSKSPQHLIETNNNDIVPINKDQEVVP